MSSPHQVLLQSNETSIFWHCLHLNSYRNRFIRKVKITVFWQFNFTDHFSSYSHIQFLEFERVLLYFFVALCFYPNLLHSTKQHHWLAFIQNQGNTNRKSLHYCIWTIKGLHVWRYIRLTSKFLYIKDSCGQLDSFHRETWKNVGYVQL